MAVLKTVALATAVVLLSGCAGRDVRGPFRNQYVDAETGKPIEGVVFLAVWTSSIPNPASGGSEQFYEAREAVSGPDGRVEIPALAGPIWRIGVGVRFYELASDGYGGGRVQVTPPGTQRYIDPTVTLMRRALTREERCGRLSFLMPSIPGNVEKISRYFAAWETELRTQCQRKDEPS